ncbi:DegT/DnrJ/EryC1/StrS aminotransferase family protein [Sphingopyxis soli]|uniref:DegT/DnrJ/EryC1/StrS aminotransferase family protein n=1 Tax=Sphingopyxis soli TaxID=592051 RepID=A0ABN1M4I2_9SPHN|nr:DegT/DnrJ/EryC1/StrS aminotransferase family protein [Sphingopyxis soli]
MLNSPVAPWPCFSQEEADRVREVLLSNRVNYWTGQETRSFETEFARWTQSRHAIALTNGTVALDLALQALGIGPGDEVVVTPRTFIASVSSVINIGATPVFADVDYDSGNISPATIAAVLTDRTRAIVPVHLGGWPADMDGIMALAADRRIKVIEDCAQAHGALVGNRSVGSIGHVGAWSFCQDKIMTTGGEGGMVTTDDDDLWSAMWSYKDHGKSWDAVYNREHPPGFRWVHESFGTNWRMLEMQAAIGRIQLGRMAEWTARRTEIADAIREALAPFPAAVRVPVAPPGMTHAYYRQYAYVRHDGLKAGWDRDRIVAECNARGAPVLHGSCSEVYLEKAFDGTPWRPAQRLAVARELGEFSLMFLTHPSQSDEDVAMVCSVVAGVISDAAR